MPEIAAEAPPAGHPQDMPAMSFGHAGTVVEKKVDSPADKIRRMREAGISVADEIGDIPRLVKDRLAGARAAGA